MSKCELCSSTQEVSAYEVPPESILLCSTCRTQIDGSSPMDPHHWYCLKESMWSERPVVQVMAWRVLNQLKQETWARDLLDQLYLDDETLEWAKAGLPEAPEEDSSAPTLDSNGTRLMDGDSVTLIKDLDVKGGGFTAKRGTLVKNISLTNDPKYIEGKVNGVQIVLVAAYLKKA